MAGPAKNLPKSLPPVTRVLARLTGARMCFGRPVTANGRTVIPVAAVRTAGGGGFGNTATRGDSGGGGGGALDARPVGFIEISADGTRFQRIDDGRSTQRAIAAAALAVLVAGRVARRRRRSRLPDRAVRLALARRAREAAAAPPARSRGGLLRRAAQRQRLGRGGHSSQRS
jgi:uncharacterized spore protein YtfJ